MALIGDKGEIPPNCRRTYKNERTRGFETAEIVPAYVFSKKRKPPKMSNHKLLKQRLNKLIGIPKPRPVAPTHSSKPTKTKIIRPPCPRSSLFRDYTYITLQKQFKNERITTEVLCYNDQLVFQDSHKLLNQRGGSVGEQRDNDQESEGWLIREQIRKGYHQLRAEVEERCKEREQSAGEGGEFGSSRSDVQEKDSTNSTPTP